MNIWAKVGLGVVIFGGGFASGYFTHKKMNDLKFEEITPEEMAAIEDQVATKEAEKASSEKDIPTTPVEEALNGGAELPENPDALRNAMQGKKPYIQADAEQKMAYEKMWKATAEYSSEENANQIPVYVTEEENHSEEEDILETEATDEFIQTIVGEAEGRRDECTEPPHVIDLAAFYNERPEYDKITINWYEPDDVWLDEKEEIIPDISSYIGLNGGGKGLFSSNGLDDDPDVRFIRNEKYGSDYEIIRHHRSYRETVVDT